MERRGELRMSEGASGNLLLELWASILTLVTGWNYVSSKQTAKDIKECSDDHVLKEDLRVSMDRQEKMLTEVRTDVKDLSKAVYRMAGSGGVKDEKDY